MLNLPSSSFLKVTLYVLSSLFLRSFLLTSCAVPPSRPRGRDHLRKKKGREGGGWGGRGARLRLFSLPAALGKQESNQVGF